MDFLHKAIFGFAQPKSNEEKLTRLGNMYGKYRLRFPTCNEADADSTFIKELKEKQDKILLVDCREDKERMVSTINHSISLNSFEAMKLSTEDLKNNYDKVVFFCTVGYRSGLYTKKMNQLGVNNAYNLVGGIIKYAHNEGSEIVDINQENKATNKIHCYGKAWENLCPIEYESVI